MLLICAPFRDTTVLVERAQECSISRDHSTLATTLPLSFVSTVDICLLTSCEEEKKIRIQDAEHEIEGEAAARDKQAIGGFLTSGSRELIAANKHNNTDSPGLQQLSCQSIQRGGIS